VRRPAAAAELLDAALRSALPAATDRAALGAQASGARAAAAWQLTPDHYQLLGLERSASDEEVGVTFE
jgi:hypothetical protein